MLLTGQSLPFATYAQLLYFLFSILSTLLAPSSAVFSTRVQQPNTQLLASATRWFSARSSSINTLSAAASLSNLSFQKNEECTSSVSSLLATASLSTTCSESIVGGNNNGSQLFSSCVNYTVVPEASTTIQITADPFAEFCCGGCAIIYPQASILHWPVQRTNTWCDSIQSSMRIFQNAAIGDENNPQPSLDPSFFQNAMGLDPEIGGEDALDDDGNIRGTYTRPPHDGTYAVAKDGFVFVSPSVYVVFPIIAATNDCGLVGNAYTSWTLGVPEHQLSTFQQGFGTSVFNPADLGCPGPDPGKLTDQFELDDEANQGAPSVLLPADLTNLDPAWKSCVLGGLDLGRDPPRALQPASNLAPKATSRDSAPIETQSVPFPHSIPKSPGPGPTQSSQKTKSGISSVPEESTKGAMKPVQESSSACLPVPRLQHSIPADASPSQQAAAPIRPRNKLLELVLTKTTPLPSSVESYISATSVAGFQSYVDAWVSDINSEASVGGLPPVAPSNPYLALPKHRSAKRYHTSLPVTQLQNSTIHPTGSVTSDVAAEASLVEPPATSPADTPRSRSSSTKALGKSAPDPPYRPAPSDPKASEDDKASQYEPCGQGNLELVAITTRDARPLSSTLSESADSASWAATSTSAHSALSTEHSGRGSDPSGSSRSASGLQSIRTSGQMSSNIATIERSSSSSLTSAAGTTSYSGMTTSTRTAMGCRLHVARSEGLWIAFLGSTVSFSLI